MILDWELVPLLAPHYLSLPIRLLLVLGRLELNSFNSLFGLASNLFLPSSAVMVDLFFISEPRLISQISLLVLLI